MTLSHGLCISSLPYRLDPLYCTIDIYPCTNMSCNLLTAKKPIRFDSSKQSLSKFND